MEQYRRRRKRRLDIKKIVFAAALLVAAIALLVVAILLITGKFKGSSYEFQNAQGSSVKELTISENATLTLKTETGSLEGVYTEVGNAEILSYDLSSGLVTALKDGSTYITAYDAKGSELCYVKVNVSLAQETTAQTENETDSQTESEESSPQTEDTTAASDETTSEETTSEETTAEVSSVPMVALTYDDGPYSPVTDKILDALEQVGGHATFFVVGNRVSTYADSVKRAVSLGCQIGNHTWDHTDLTTLSYDDIVSKIDQCVQAVQDAAGVAPEIVRPVGGALNDTVYQAVAYPMITWSIDTEDWRDRDAQMCYDAVINNVEDGDVILMHDLYESTGEASVNIINTLTEMGYKLVTVSELAAAKGYTLEAHCKYSSFY